MEALSLVGENASSLTYQEVGADSESSLSACVLILYIFLFFENLHL